jgi:hypothetical protein
MVSTDREARRRYKKRSEQKYPEKVRARRAVQQAISRGVLTRPGNCEHCGKHCRPEASHDDYAKPLEVEWLCKRCHIEKDLKSHCVNGHEFTPENTRINSAGYRDCRTCVRDREAQRVTCSECGSEMRRGSIYRHRKECHDVAA